MEIERAIALRAVALSEWNHNYLKAACRGGIYPMRQEEKSRADTAQ